MGEVCSSCPDIILHILRRIFFREVVNFKQSLNLVIRLLLSPCINHILVLCKQGWVLDAISFFFVLPALVHVLVLPDKLKLIYFAPLVHPVTCSVGVSHLLIVSVQSSVKRYRWLNLTSVSYYVFANQLTACRFWWLIRLCFRRNQLKLHAEFTISKV